MSKTPSSCSTLSQVNAYFSRQHTAIELIVLGIYRFSSWKVKREQVLYSVSLLEFVRLHLLQMRPFLDLAGSGI